MPAEPRAMEDARKSDPTGERAMAWFNELKAQQDRGEVVLLPCRVIRYPDDYEEAR